MNWGGFMRFLIVTFGFLFAMSAFAQSAGTYFTSSPNGVPLNVFVTPSSSYQLEVNSYARKADADPWNLDGNITLCFSVQTKPDCYHSIANFLGVIGLPKNVGGPVVYTNYIYGLGFADPSAGKVKVTTQQSIKKKAGDDGSWIDISPALVRSEMTIEVGSWASIEFREDQDSMRKIEVRIIPSIP
jgi:hypothetical protein